MPELVLLGGEVAGVVFVGRDLNRYALFDVQAIAAFEADDFFRIVGKQADLANAEIDEDLGADSVLAQIRREAEALIGFDGVQPLQLLQLIGAQLGQQADAAAFLAHVQDDTLARLGDLEHRLVQLRAAVAQHAGEDVAGQALAVNANKNRLGLHRHLPVDFNADAAIAQREVRLRIDDRGVRDQVEFAVLGRQLENQLAVNEAFALTAELDQVFDGAHLEAVLPAKRAELRQTGHVTV